MRSRARSVPSRSGLARCSPALPAVRGRRRARAAPATRSPRRRPTCWPGSCTATTSAGGADFVVTAPYGDGRRADADRRGGLPRGDRPRPGGDQLRRRPAGRRPHAVLHREDALGRRRRPACPRRWRPRAAGRHLPAPAADRPATTARPLLLDVLVRRCCSTSSAPDGRRPARPSSTAATPGRGSARSTAGSTSLFGLRTGATVAVGAADDLLVQFVDAAGRTARST